MKAKEPLTRQIIRVEKSISLLPKPLHYTLSEFLAAKNSEGKSSHTICSYGDGLNRFCRYLVDRGIDDIAAVDTGVIRGFLATLREEGKQSGTIQTRYLQVHSFFTFLMDEDLIKSNPMERVRRPKLEKKVVRALSEDQFHSVMQKLDTRSLEGARNKAILLVLLDSGIRKSELLALDLESWSESVLTVAGKGGKQRRVRLGFQANKSLARYLRKRDDDSHAMWVNSAGGRLGQYALNSIFRTVGSELKENGVKFTPHIMRHTFATAYLRNGGDMETLRQMLGHSSLDMVERYLRSLTDEDAIRAHERFSPGDRWG